jgi:hypothetical protein
LRVRVDPTDEPASAAVILASDWAATGYVVTVNVPLLCPPEIVTEAGTAAAVWLELKLTIIPPDGAGTLRETVPVEVVPPKTVGGARIRFDIAGG